MPAHTPPISIARRYATFLSPRSTALRRLAIRQVIRDPGVLLFLTLAVPLALALIFPTIMEIAALSVSVRSTRGPTSLICLIALLLGGVVIVGQTWERRALSLRLSLAQRVCRQCLYDLTGVSNERCPECGDHLPDALKGDPA